MKRKTMRFFLILLVLLLLGCSSTAESKKTLSESDTIEDNSSEAENLLEEESVEKKLTTREQIKKRGGLTDEDLEGIEVEAIIENEQLTEEEVENCAPENILPLLRMCQEDLHVVEEKVQYLFEGDAPAESFEIDQIKKIAFLEAKNELSWIWYLNLEEMKGYHGMGNMDDALTQADQTKELADADIKAMLESFERASIFEWKTSYLGTNGDTTGDWGWELGVELRDGSVYSWGGDGLWGDNKPAKFNIVKDAVLACMKEE